MKDKDLRHIAFLALEKIARANKDLGPAAAGAVPVLIEALKAPSSEVECKKPEEVYTRRSAANVLGLFASEKVIGQQVEKAAVRGLSDALKDCAPDVQYNAALALGWYGRAAKPAFSTLVEIVRDKKNDYYLRREAYNSLEKIDEEAAKKVERP